MFVCSAVDYMVVSLRRFVRSAVALLFVRVSSAYSRRRDSARSPRSNHHRRQTLSVANFS